MIRNIVIVSLLSSWAAFAKAEPQQHELPPGLQARIILLNGLAYLQGDLLDAFAKARASELHDQVTARVAREVMARSGKSEVEFAAAVGVTVEELQQVLNAGKGLDREALKRMWDLGMLTVEELIPLRGNVIVAGLSEQEQALIVSPGSGMVSNVLRIIKFIQISERDKDSLQLPPVESIVEELRNDYDTLLQLAGEHYPEVKEFIALDKLNDELTARIVTVSEAEEKLIHHDAFMFFGELIAAWRAQQQEAAKQSS